MHNYALNAVAFWILNFVVTKLHKKFRRQIERCQIVFSDFVGVRFARCHPLDVKGTNTQFGLARHWSAVQKIGNLL